MAKTPRTFADELVNLFGIVLPEDLKTKLIKRLDCWRDEHLEVELSWMKESLEEIRNAASNRLADITVRQRVRTDMNLTAPWQSWDGVPVDTTEREALIEMALKDIADKNDDRSLTDFMLTGDTLILTTRYLDGVVEQYDCVIRRHRKL